MVGGVALILEPHSSVCLGVCPDLGRVGQPQVRRVWLLGTKRVELVDFL